MKRALLRRVPLGTVILALAAGFATVTGGALEPTRTERPSLEGGAGSVDELVAKFLDALSAKDRGALEAIRVTEDEYRNVIVPGSVLPGEPPQVLSEEASDYFYGILDGKSSYHRDAILAKWGGTPLKVAGYSFEKGEKQYAGYRGYKRLTLEVIGPDGKEQTLRTGSIAEVDGRFKFVSFIRD